MSLAAGGGAARLTTAPDEAVVCVHGLWLSGFATRYWRVHLARAGFAACSFSYPSVRARLAHNRAALLRFVAALPQQRIHFAGHSLGAVTIVSMLDEQQWCLPGKTLGRIVLAGPPFQGSHAGKTLVDWKHSHAVLGSVGKALAGEALQDWLSGHRPSVPAHVDVGVIAGDASIGMGRVIAPGLPKPHDGTVSVAETRVTGAREHIVLPVSHTTMLMSQQVVKRMIRFLEAGTFGSGAAIGAIGAAGQSGVATEASGGPRPAG